MAMTRIVVLVTSVGSLFSSFPFAMSRQITRHLIPDGQKYWLLNWARARALRPDIDHHPVRHLHRSRCNEGTKWRERGDHLRRLTSYPITVPNLSSAKSW